MTAVRARLPFVLFVALTLHESLFRDTRVGDVRPDVMLALAVAAGIVGGAERGAVTGFVAGLLADLFVQTPLGLSALAFSLVGFAVGSLQSAIIRAAWWIPPLTAFVASLAGVLLYAVLGAIIGRAEFVRPEVAVVAAGVGAMNAVLALPAVRLMSWALPARPETSFVR